VDVTRENVAVLQSIRNWIWMAAVGIWIIAGAAVVGIPQVNERIFPAESAEEGQVVAVRIASGSSTVPVEIAPTFGRAPIEVKLAHSYSGELFSCSDGLGSESSCPIWVTAG
jgi:hypothetical protein